MRVSDRRMNGAEPEEAYVGNLGSNLRMVLDTYDQLIHGMQPVLEQFSKTEPYMKGASLEACFEAGKVCADEVVQSQEFQVSQKSELAAI